MRRYSGKRVRRDKGKVPAVPGNGLPRPMATDYQGRPAQLENRNVPAVPWHRRNRSEVYPGGVTVTHWTISLLYPFRGAEAWNRTKRSALDRASAVDYPSK
jgi:hypothetical protein